jgi:predicted alpha/beta hydrolase family esterase
MAILRLCEQIKVKGLILVSAGYNNDDKKRQLWNWNKIKSNTQWIEQFQSSDDPFTPVDSSRHIARELQSIYHEFTDRNHFLCTEFPDIINIIKYRCQLS